MGFRDHRDKVEKGKAMGINLQEALADPSKLDITDAAAHEAIMKELAALEGNAPAEAPKEEPKAEAEPEKGDAAAAKTEESPAAKTDDAKKEDAPKGVVAPDGKSIIPYGVLQGERTARQTAERALEEMSDRFAELQDRLKALESGKPADATKSSDIDEINGQIDKLAEEAPEVAEMMRKIVSANQARVEELQAKLDKVETTQAKSEEEIEADINREVGEAIDNNPALTYWRAEKPELFAEAVAFDDVLKHRPEWQGKPFAERFEKVVKLVAADHAGEDILPAEPKQEPKVDPVKPKADPAAVAKAAEAKLAKAEQAPGVTTLSDLPAGAAIEQSEQEKLESMSSVELELKFRSMTPDQINAYLQKVSS
jgi:hypothetical protein